MKSFTVTFHHTQNYGATLQAYALQHYLESCGVENEIMEYEDLPDSKKRSSLKQRAIGIILSVLETIRKKDLTRTKEEFLKFHNDYMKFSRPYADAEDLRRNPPKAEILITGSDQVWNLKTNPKMIPARFLDFGKEDAIRFSYAASIGRLNYSEEQKNQITAYLNKFKGISLREGTATEYISRFCGRECCTVCDPVFLLNRNEWNQIAKKRKVVEGPYILCYFVQGNDRIKEVVRRVRKETGYKVVAINCGVLSRVHADVQLFDVSPQEFLGLYSNASIVITTSFHGTAFALLYGKPVYAFVKGDWDTRISDLLERVGLADYAIGINNQIKPVNEINDSQEKLSGFIEVSKQFINIMLFE